MRSSSFSVGSRSMNWKTNFEVLIPHCPCYNSPLPSFLDWREPALPLPLIHGAQARFPLSFSQDSLDRTSLPVIIEFWHRLCVFMIVLRESFFTSISWLLLQVNSELADIHIPYDWLLPWQNILLKITFKGLVLFPRSLPQFSRTYQSGEYDAKTACLRTWMNNLRFRTNLKEGIMAAEKSRSKTDVSARAENKNKGLNCRICGKKADVVMAVSPTGKKRVRRVCCES